MASKYDALAEHLRSLPGKEVTLTFKEIEAILGTKLPDSAYRHRPFWSNAESPWMVQAAHGWRAAGWKVVRGSVVQTVTFRKDE